MPSPFQNSGDGDDRIERSVDENHGIDDLTNAATEGVNSNVADTLGSGDDSAFCFTSAAEDNTDRSTQAVDVEMKPRLPFAVVGIGASAGGLEAYTELFKAMPADSGMAFVLIQHLPPDRESMVAELLSRHTTMPVHQVEDGTAVEVNNIYVIRPGKTLTIKDGTLHLGARLEKPMHNRPVDDFFRSLAEEQRERGICVILSGMGSNGSAGAQMIKAVGGLCVAQDPETAQYPSMPRHLIEAGYADYVLKLADMPDVLMAYAGHPYARQQSALEQSVRREGQYMREVFAMLRTRTRHDFSGYKKPTILRRVQRRMGLHRLTRLSEYTKVLRQSPTEISALADDLLIHVTGFFRDPESWKKLHETVIVPLVHSRENNASLRCWITACSSGEEAYSLAILLVEEMERAGKQFDIKVFATDVAARTLANARNGVYPGGIESEISPERLERFFQKEDAVYRVRQDIRERVVFAPQNVLQDPPFSRLDIVSCRNLLIYLETDVQERVLHLIHFGLREGGALFLGSSETVGSLDDMFTPIDKAARLYRRVGPTRHGSVEFPLPHVSVTDRSSPAIEERDASTRSFKPKVSIAQQTARVLLEEHSPAAVTVDRGGRIVYFHGNTSPYLIQPRGEPTRDLLELSSDETRGAVRTALHRVAVQNRRVVVPDGWIVSSEGHRVRVVITASPLEKVLMPGYFVISFEEREAIATPPSSPGEMTPADEVQRLRDELQSTIEQLQTSNEEMKVSNEEITSTNEEMQSTNEELETSREEMQSLNEELSTVNSQLQAKMEEHQATSNDLFSLLSSTAIAVLFLDSKLRIRQFTPAVKDLIDVISTDIGRLMTDLAWKFTDADLAIDAASVLRDLVPIQREISANGGRWYSRKITPYRTVDNRIEGVVVTFVDVTERRRVTDAFRESEERYRLMVADVKDYGIFMVDTDQRIVTWNAGAERITGFLTADVLHQPANILYTAQQRADRLAEKEFDEALRTGQFTASRWHVRKDGSLFWANCAMTAINDRQGNHRGFAIVTHDGTERVQAEQTRTRLAAVVESSADAIMAFTVGGKILTWNAAAERIYGFSAGEAVGMQLSMLIPDDAQMALHDSAMAALARGESVLQLDLIHRAKDGQRFSVSFTAAPIKKMLGDGLEQAAAVVQDISGRKIEEKLAQQAITAAREASRAKDEFLATISHELRTPLSAILVWSNVLRTSTEPGSEQAEGLSAIIRSAESQKELIEDLLDSSRITTGQMRMEMRDVELAPLIKDAADAIAPTAEAKEVDVALELNANVGLVRADPSRLRQVIWNLLTNAVKFTPADGRVTVNLARKAGDVQITVTDTGRGIDAKFLPHVFEQFRQADAVSTRTQDGIGLGLSIVKHLVELHGGTIDVRSPGLDQGSVFTVRLPLPKLGSVKPRNRASAEIGVAADEAPSLAGLRVLLVEDEAETRKAFAMVLRRTLIEVEAVGAVAPALAAIELTPPDLIVSDIGLPDEDGYTLIRKIRERERLTNTQPIPAIALTAFSSEQDREKAIASGFQLHLAKPVSPADLTAAIRAVLAASV